MSIDAALADREMYRAQVEALRAENAQLRFMVLEVPIGAAVLQALEMSGLGEQATALANLRDFVVRGASAQSLEAIREAQRWIMAGGDHHENRKSDGSPWAWIDSALEALNREFGEATRK